MTQEEKNKLILSKWTKERLAEEWVREHIKYNDLKEELEKLEEQVNYWKTEHSLLAYKYKELLKENRKLKKQLKDVMK